MWNTDTLDKFTRITGFDYSLYLNDFFIFNENQKQKIFDYYEGFSEVDGAAFRELDRLRSESKNAINIATFNRESFSMFDDWDLFEFLEDVDRKLNTIFNSSKYLRSAINTGNFSPNPLVDVTLSANKTLESLASDLSSDDPQNDWSNIFLNNQLTEESYTSDGGNLLKVTFEGANPLFLTSTIDNIDSSEKVYGLDIQDKLEFADNNLKVLSYSETLNQSSKILSELKRGDNPEFPEQGVDVKSIVGSTFASVTFPSIFRQLYQSFATDDSFRSFSIIDVQSSGDYFSIFYQITTRSNEVVEGSLVI